MRLGAASRALVALERAGGHGLLEEHRVDNGRLYPTDLGQHDQATWMRLKNLGYVKSTSTGSSVTLTALGKSRVQEGYAAQEDLRQRCEKIAREEGLIP